MAEIMQVSKVTGTVIIHYFQILISVHSALQEHKSADPCSENK